MTNNNNNNYDNNDVLKMWNTGVHFSGADTSGSAASYFCWYFLPDIVSGISRFSPLAQDAQDKSPRQHFLPPQPRPSSGQHQAVQLQLWAQIAGTNKTTRLIGRGLFRDVLSAEWRTRLNKVLTTSDSHHIPKVACVLCLCLCVTCRRGIFIEWWKLS